VQVGEQPAPCAYLSRNGKRQLSNKKINPAIQGDIIDVKNNLSGLNSKPEIINIDTWHTVKN